MRTPTAFIVFYLLTVGIYIYRYVMNDNKSLVKNYPEFIVLIGLVSKVKKGIVKITAYGIIDLVQI